MPTKIWAVGEEVLAADFNTYVQKQVVATFDTAAQRDTALPSPETGACCWADGRLQVYQGATRGWCVIDPAAQLSVALPIFNPVTAAGQSILDTLTGGNPTLLGRTQVSVAVNFTLHALDTATSTWTARIQVGGASYLDPAGYAFLPANGSATAVSFTHLVDAPAGSTRFQVVITRTAGTGACRTFAQNNAMVLRY